MAIKSRSPMGTVANRTAQHFNFDDAGCVAVAGQSRTSRSGSVGHTTAPKGDGFGQVLFKPRITLASGDLACAFSDGKAIARLVSRITRAVKIPRWTRLSLDPDHVEKPRQDGSCGGNNQEGAKAHGPFWTNADE